MFAHNTESSDAHHDLQYADTHDPHALYTNLALECLCTV